MRGGAGDAVAVGRQWWAGFAREEENAGQANRAVKHNASQDTEPAKIVHYRPDGFLQVINLTPAAATSSVGRHVVARHDLVLWTTPAVRNQQPTLEL
jgi:hypothetical protein